MKYRKLRIAWSAASGLVGVLLVALWVRSYWYRSGVSGKIADNYIIVETLQGEAMLNVVTRFKNPLPTSLYSKPISSSDSQGFVKSKNARGRVGIHWWPYGHGFGFTIFLLWPIVIIAGVSAILIIGMPSALTRLVTKLKLRFSLRTLLIATTFVAAALGLIVWLTR